MTAPAGRRIVFVRGGRTGFCPACPLQPNGATSELYVMNADGTGMTRLTDNGVAEGTPAWRPAAPA